MLASNHVLITDENGVVENIVDATEAGDNVEMLEGILSPGLINAHCHVELSHLKGKIPQHTGLVTFVQQIMQLRATALEEKQEAIRAAVQDMWNTGIVAVGDICNTTDSVMEKIDSPIYWHNFIEISGFVDATAADRFAAGQQILQTFKNASLPHSSITAHAPYSVSKTLFEFINQTADSSLISIHNQETTAEDELFLNKSGAMLDLYKNLGLNIDNFSASQRSSFQTWLPYFTRKQTIITVHNSFHSENDIAFALERNRLTSLFYCICINANLYIENSIPPINMLLQKGANLVVGTDSLASNHTLNLMDEVTSIKKHFPAIPIVDLLKFCTINGAKALGIKGMYGSFEKGKKPGLVRVWEEGLDRFKSERII